MTNVTDMGKDVIMSPIVCMKLSKSLLLLGCETSVCIVDIHALRLVASFKVNRRLINACLLPDVENTNVVSVIVADRNAG